MNQSAFQDLSAVLGAVEAAGLFSSLCSVYEFPDPETTGVSAWGQVNLTDAVPVTGLQNIPCMKAPMPVGDPSANNEKRGSELIEQTNVFHALLDGFYPTVVQRQLAVIDGVAHSILNTESDSQSIMTRLAVRVYAL
jgi:hypothetical protein